MLKDLFSEFDWGLFLAILLVGIFGLVTLASVAPQFLLHQLVFFLLGLVAFFIFSLIDYRIWERLSFLLFLLIIGLLITPLAFGTIARGTLRWVQLGLLNFQPSELIKPFLIVVFASLFSNKNKKLGLVLIVIPVVLIFLQPALGNSLVVLFAWLGILFSSSVSGRFLVLFGLVFSSLTPVLWRFLKQYQRQRILSFLRPLDDPLGTGYHLIQSTVAIGSGQFFGRGLGRGTQSRLLFLPERHTDFIFASLAEEWGFFGASILIFSFAFLLWRILVIGQQARDSFGRLISLGMFSLFFIQILVNIGMNLGIMPITGITLPLVSYGANSLLAMMIGLGIVANIHRLKYNYPRD